MPQIYSFNLSSSPEQRNARMSHSNNTTKTQPPESCSFTPSHQITLTVVLFISVRVVFRLFAIDRRRFLVVLFCCLVFSVFKTRLRDSVRRSASSTSRPEKTTYFVDALVDFAKAVTDENSKTYNTPARLDLNLIITLTARRYS